MKRWMLLIPLCLLLTGCQQSEPETILYDTPAYTIELSDTAILYEGQPISGDPDAAVYAARDIVYYPTGMDFTFGEGTEADAHAPEEAAAHTVIHITEPGMYRISGKLSAGQIAVDLGKDAKKDPEAVVELILDGVDITCTVAPAVIFYNVYECGDKDQPTRDADTSGAGAVVRLTDGSINTVRGSYVARIYKPDSVELNKDGTAVADAKKLHKYDAAFYSKMSMNINGRDGILNILAENEGLGSEMHLTINGGDIRIESGNDGINTNEDGVSVTAINGGSVSVRVNGSTGEGDGIDSNGWLVINGGHVTAYACGFSMDSGIDADMGIHINGGTVIAAGNMTDRLGECEQNHAAFSFAHPQTGGQEYRLLSGDSEILTFSPPNDFSCLIVSSETLIAGEYSFFCGNTQLSHQDGGDAAPGGVPPFGGMEPPAGMPPPKGDEFPVGNTMPPIDKDPPGQLSDFGNSDPVFRLRDGGNSFFRVDNG